VTASPFANALILTGPTAAGKSALGLDLAERLNAEIIAADSMTLYRGMDIGTAKPSAADRERIPHHLIDVLDPWESASVAWWLEQAGAAVADIERRGKTAMFVGGTPFYLKALLCGLFPSPPADQELRRRLEADAGTGGREALHDRLAAVDPASARRLHPNDVRRVVRALEVWNLTGKPISAWQQQAWWDGETPRFRRGSCLVIDVPGRSYTPGSTVGCKRCSRPAGSRRSAGCGRCRDRCRGRRPRPLGTAKSASSWTGGGRWRTRSPRSSCGRGSSPSGS